MQKIISRIRCQTLAADSLDVFNDHFMPLQKCHQYNRKDIEEKDIVNRDNTRNMPKAGHRKPYTESMDTIRQSKSRAIDIHKKTTTRLKLEKL